MVSKNRFDTLSFDIKIDLVLLGIYVCISAREYFKNRKERQLRKGKHFYLPNYRLVYQFNINKMMTKLSRWGFSKKSLKYHGIFILMYILTIKFKE